MSKKADKIPHPDDITLVTKRSSNGRKHELVMSADREISDEEYVLELERHIFEVSQALARKRQPGEREH